MKRNGPRGRKAGGVKSVNPKENWISVVLGATNHIKENKFELVASMLKTLARTISVNQGEQKPHYSRLDGRCELQEV